MCVYVYVCSLLVRVVFGTFSSLHHERFFLGIFSNYNSSLLIDEPVGSTGLNVKFHNLEDSLTRIRRVSN